MHKIFAALFAFTLSSASPIVLAHEGATKLLRPPMANRARRLLHRATLS